MAGANLVGIDERAGARPAAGTPPGAVLDERYLLGERLGRGASAQTFRADDRQTGAVRAVRVLEVGGSLERAAQAVRRLQALSHPGVIKVHDVGTTPQGRLYVVMDLVAGAALTSIAALTDDAIRRRAFQSAAHALVDAVAYLHGRGIVHADICPANVRLDEDGRPVLLDFDLQVSALAGAAGTGARGTLGYAAPEALIGQVGPAADLFSVGATLFESWAGTPPFGVGIEAVQRVLSTRAPLLSTARAGLPAAWDPIIARLLAARPEDRYPSARELLRALIRVQQGDDAPVTIDLRAPYPGGDPLAGIVVGRDQQRDELRLAIEGLAEGAASCAAIAVVGVPGSGRRTVIDLVVRDAAIASAAQVLPRFALWQGQLLTLEAETGAGGTAGIPTSDDDGREESRGRFARLAEALERKAAQQPLCVVLRPDADAQAFAAAVASAEPSGRLLVMLAAEQALARPFARNVVVGPLDRQAIAELCARAAGGPVPARAVELIARASAGRAATAAVLARALVEAVRRGEADSFRVEARAELSELLAEGFRALASPARQAVARLALALPPPPPLLDPAPENDEATCAGWMVRGAGGLPQLPSEVHAKVALAALADPDLRAVAFQATHALDEGDPGRAAAHAALGERDDACRGYQTAAAQAVALGEPGRAALHLYAADQLHDGALTFAERLTLATGLASLGRYSEATVVLDRAKAGIATSADRLRLLERQAWLQGRQGDVAGAIATLRSALSTDAPGDGDTGNALLGQLRVRLARLLASAGQGAAAIDVLAPLLEGGRQPSAEAREVAILASAYAGQLGEARRLLQPPPAGGDALPPGRVLYLGALLDQFAGQLAAAADGYRQAMALSVERDDVHTEAAVALNLATVLAEQGVYGEAMSASHRAITLLGRLGATAELGTALLNVANLFVLLGELSAAQRALARAADEATARGGAGSRAYARFVEADLQRRRGDGAAALATYQDARRRLAEAGLVAAARSAALAEADTLIELNRAADGAQLVRAHAAPSADAGASSDDERDLTLARLALAGQDVATLGRPAAVLAEALEHASAAAERATRRPVAWRSALLGARLFHQIGAGARARPLLERARRIFQEVRMATPDTHRSGLDADADAPWLSGPTGAATSADATLALRAARTENRLRRLLRINKRLNSELRLPRLLETIIDAVIELTDAERGFILLEDDAGQLVVRIARNIDQRTLDTAEFELSRSIARQAASGGAPIVTIDAAGDDRFKQAMSVSDLHLRSVLAVPLQIKGRAAGTIYVDNRLRKGAFAEDDVALVLDFAEQAAIAIENARLLSELRRRERQVDALNRRLQDELSERKEELSGMKQELRENRGALAVRYDYRNIIGRTPRMLDLFRLLDRLTDTTLPVVIQGESGTGKELVARAIHFNGSRRERPFVSENCAAIPETLLESTLFGYARGAFTGAEHDTRGLFEVADGGTLFLDEIAEMSAGMQGKLLRVLQQGEFRRVGSERTRKVDVRIVAATNRDLARMVDEGKFRQDLYYRLNVARIFLPPLRDRREDIPLIIEHFLARQPGGVRKPVDPAAMARLVAYRWPGNVRELENEIMRAVALSGERVSASDLSPAIATNTDPGAISVDDPDSLILRNRVERLERSLLREALARCGNNQTKAALVLGLSRFGLQKKIKRYRLC